MAVKRNVNTEPDDAFSAVFGDIDQTPLMRQSGEKAQESAKEHETRDKEDAARDLDLEAFEDHEPKEAGDLDLEAFEAQEPEETEDPDPEAFEDQEPEEAEDLDMEGIEDQEAEELEAEGLEAEETASMEVTEQDGAQTIAPSGDLRGEAAEKLMAVLLESLEKDLAHHRLDLEKVGAVDASGLSALVYFAQALKTRNQNLEIINANQDLLNLFSAGRLDKTYAVSFS